MTLKSYSSSDKEISVSGVAASPKNSGAGGLLKGMKKDVRKRWMYTGIALVGAFVMASSWLSSKTPKTPDAPTVRPIVETTPKGINDHNNWREQTGLELNSLRKELNASQQTQRELTKTLSALQEELKKVRDERLAPPLPISLEPKKPEPSRILLPDPPAPPPSLQPKVSAPPPALVVPTPTTALPSTPPATPKRTPARAFLPEGTLVNQQLREAEYQEFEKNDRAGFLPAGSFAKATMISGAEAFTGGTAQSQPQPVVLRLDADAVLPNAAKYQIRGCHVLASVWGDMSSERVFGRLATLTCVNMENKLVLSQEVEGVLVDSDGKNGVRGHLIDRQGAKLARALLAGLAEGMSDALGAAQSTSMVTGSGITTAFTGNHLASAGYGGASKAAEQLSEFYMKQAEATMPVIAVDAGRRISVLFTKSQSLKFDSVDRYKAKEEQKITIVR